MTTAAGAGGGGNGTILEDDQQLYDWGIENRLDQYYQVYHNYQLYKKILYLIKDNYLLV